MKEITQQLDALGTAIQQLESVLSSSSQQMENIVRDYWDLVSFENSVRKSAAATPGQPDPNWHRPTPLSLSMRRYGDSVYVSWIRQDSSLQTKKDGGSKKAPYKHYIAKGRGSNGYSLSVLEKHMRGWEREIVVRTEKRLNEQRNISKVGTVTLKQLRTLRDSITSHKDD